MGGVCLTPLSLAWVAARLQLLLPGHASFRYSGYVMVLTCSASNLTLSPSDGALSVHLRGGGQQTLLGNRPLPAVPYMARSSANALTFLSTVTGVEVEGEEVVLTLERELPYDVR